jgi:hypothetical protein
MRTQAAEHVHEAIKGDHSRMLTADRVSRAPLERGTMRHVADGVNEVVS